MTQQTPQLIRMKKWMRKSTINFFERNPDVIAVPSFVPLCHQMVVDVMSTGFEVVTRDTYFVTCRARQILAQNLKGDIYQEDEIFKAEKTLNAHLERLHDYFDTRITQAEQKLELGGFSGAEIQRLVTNYETRTATNAVTQYLDILAKADLYLTMLHYLWATGELSDDPNEAVRVKLNTEREVRQNLFAVTRASNVHYNNIRRICNGVIEQRRKERAAQSERDRLRHEERKAKLAQAEANRQAAQQQRKEERRDKRLQEQESAIVTAQAEMDGLAAAADEQIVADADADKLTA